MAVRGVIHHRGAAFRGKRVVPLFLHSRGTYRRRVFFLRIFLGDLAGTTGLCRLPGHRTVPFLTSRGSGSAAGSSRPRSSRVLGGWGLGRGAGGASGACPGFFSRFLIVGVSHLGHAAFVAGVVRGLNSDLLVIVGVILQPHVQSAIVQIRKGVSAHIHLIYTGEVVTGLHPQKFPVNPGPDSGGFPVKNFYVPVLGVGLPVLVCDGHINGAVL